MNLENIAKYIASQMDSCVTSALTPEKFNALDFSMLDYKTRIELLFLVEKYPELSVSSLDLSVKVDCLVELL